jgi:hypothetical protein
MKPQPPEPLPVWLALVLTAWLVGLLAGLLYLFGGCSHLAVSHRKEGDRKGSLMVLEVGDGVSAELRVGPCPADAGRPEDGSPAPGREHGHGHEQQDSAAEHL